MPRALGPGALLPLCPRSVLWLSAICAPKWSPLLRLPRAARFDGALPCSSTPPIGARSRVPVSFSDQGVRQANLSGPPSPPDSHATICGPLPGAQPPVHPPLCQDWRTAGAPSRQAAAAQGGERRQAAAGERPRPAGGAGLFRGTPGRPHRASSGLGSLGMPCAGLAGKRAGRGQQRPILPRRLSRRARAGTRWAGR